jgi:hypothetical protein
MHGFYINIKVAARKKKNYKGAARARAELHDN